MTITDPTPLLSFNHSTIHTNSLEQLVSMWSVISKCKDHLEGGVRLENLSWRQWYQQHQQQQTHSSSGNQSNLLSLSAGPARHEVSQKKKETQKDQVLGKDKDDWSLLTVKSSPLAKNDSNNDNYNNDNYKSKLLMNSSPASRTTTPSLSDSYPNKDDLYYDDDDDDDDFYEEEYDEDIYDDDDLYDDDDNYIYQEEEFMHRPYFQKKTLPQPLIQRPSLLSALFKTPPSSSSSSSSRAPNTHDHFLAKEWTQSLRDNVLWEHVQQKPFFTPPKKPDHHHQAWLESFHGW